MWEGLIKYYDNLVAAGKPVCPVAHTYITCHIGVLLDMDGNFLCAQVPEVRSELIPVPCTVQSEARTSGIAPHLLSDNIAYVADFPGYEERHKAYMEQLGNYVKNVHWDKYANSIYKYTKSGTILNDLKDLLLQIKGMPKHKINIIFCVYGLPNEGADPHWSKYYPSTLSKNGLCCATGEHDYIPAAYPAGILSTSGNERLFLEGFPVGYIASQKIIHALQYTLYGRQNADRVEIEYTLKNFSSGEMGEKEFIQWLEGKYPGRSEELYNNIITGNSGN